MKTTDDFLVRIWLDFVDWEKRKEGENGFIRKQLESHGCKKVYDLCLGGGYDSIDLVKNGFDVTSNELDNSFRNLALENARAEGIELKLTSYDWREIDVDSEFDAAIMLGNSLVYIHDKGEQQDILKRICHLLRPNGIFIIDHRNFEYIFSDAEEILKNPLENFRYSGKINYSHDKIKAYPINIAPHSVMFEYLDTLTGEKGYINQNPIFEDKLKAMLLEVGFSEIPTYYDYKKQKPEHYDFIQHVAVK